MQVLLTFSNIDKIRPFSLLIVKLFNITVFTLPDTVLCGLKVNYNFTTVGGDLDQKKKAKDKKSLI